MKHAVCALALLVMALACSKGRTEERTDFFESKIRPVLVETCFRCHGGTKTSGGLRLDSREGLLKGGDSGLAIIPHKPMESLLIRVIRREAGIAAMPPEKNKALRPEQVADFVSWIESGAVWPANTVKFGNKKHWAFEPIRDTPIPHVKDKDWVKTSVDSFIRSRQEALAVHPASSAGKLTLIRRATFDLTGLPPKPEEVATFLADKSPQAYERLIDRLLQSPAYGEHWGRHWLDVVRYADTAGDTADYPAPLAWKYRNYVINSFNADKPYDQFLREQVAGDVLALKGPREKYAEQVTATGFLAVSRRFGFDSENYHHLTIQDTIDTLGQAALGLSLGCARCHDHKFDAIMMRDYYGLYAIFDSSRYAFPGSEQKQRMTTLAPLAPPDESGNKWTDYESRVAMVSDRLSRQKQPVPVTPLHSLHEMDGDFETQAPAAGGSNGVLVLPWLYEGNIAVTASAQSPFKNLHPAGRLGTSIAARTGHYRLWQAPIAIQKAEVVFANLDFRISGVDAATQGFHSLVLGSIAGVAAVEIRLGIDSVVLQTGGTPQKIAVLKPNEWQNLQLVIDLKTRKVSGRVGSPGAVTAFQDKPISSSYSGSIEALFLKSVDEGNKKLPAIDYDNIGLRKTPIAEVATTKPAPINAPPDPDSVAIAAELQQLAGFDGDFENQTRNMPPVAPWNPGPNSLVKISEASQSPFRNLYEAGRLGVHMPNRGQYDGFGLTISNAAPDSNGRLHISYDFRCADATAGGGGTWRYYIGQGPGNSAAIELYFNAKELFNRSGNDTKSVDPLMLGEWYQIRLVLDVKARKYTGVLESSKFRKEFHGDCSAGWTGVIDYSFIDSYGHIPGVRPAIDADNFVVGAQPIVGISVPLIQRNSSADGKRKRIAELRKQLETVRSKIEEDRKELARLVEAGPFEVAYAMAEGTPHSVRMQLRGEPDRPGEVVKRGTIQSLAGGPLPEGTPGSGRLELAQWLTRPTNPLTARVMANRIWQYHFGRGLVKTPNDFGVRGIPPTHPELLDHLATRFMQSGWSMKAMHRLVMLSSTYQQAVAEPNAKSNADTDDLYVSFLGRRLGAEEIRDAILAVSGELDTAPAKEHPFPSPVSWGFSQHAPFSAVYDHDKRSVYLMTQRLKRHPYLALFDGADPNATTADRLSTTVPTQALYFLNDPFVHAKSMKLARRLLTHAPDEKNRIELAWQQSMGRLPGNVELQEAKEFLAAYRVELKSNGLDDLETRALAAYLRSLFGSNEFLHVD